MTISPTSVRFDDDTMWVELTDGHTLDVPLSSAVTRDARRARTGKVEPLGLRWEAIEDISIAGLLAGRGDVTRSTEHAASPVARG